MAADGQIKAFAILSLRELQKTSLLRVTAWPYFPLYKITPDKTYVILIKHTCILSPVIIILIARYRVGKYKLHIFHIFIEDNKEEIF